jgi:hypothetical protein
MFPCQGSLENANTAAALIFNSEPPGRSPCRDVPTRRPAGCCTSH